MKLDELLEKYCPNGVEYVTLGSLGKFENIGVDKKTNPGEPLVYLLNYVDVYHYKHLYKHIPTMQVSSPERKVVACNVLKGDIFVTPSSETVDDIGHSTVAEEDLPNTVYSYHIMRYRLDECDMTYAHFINYMFDSDEVKSQILKLAQGLTRFGLSKDKFASIRIPFPPKEVQEHIINILDTFSAQISNLEAELVERQKQFEFYRNQLLDFTNRGGQCKCLIFSELDKVIHKSLGEIGLMIKGSGIQKSDFVDNGCPCIHYGQVHTFFGTSATQVKSYIPEALYKKCRKAKFGDLIIATTSEDVEACCKAVAWLGDDEVAVSGDAHIFRHNQDPLYIAYLFQTEAFAKQKRFVAKGAKVTRVPGDAMLKFEFLFPSIESQKMISDKLRSFELLIDNIKEEISLRQNQYEYYRKQILTF